MTYNASQALDWANTHLRKLKPANYRNYAVLDLVSFMGIIGEFTDEEWYRSYALLQFYNTLGKDKQNSYGMKYHAPVKFSYTNGEGKDGGRNKDTRPTVDKNPAARANKNVELHGCGQCAWFAEQACSALQIPQLTGKPAPPKLEQVALSNHNLARVNGDAAEDDHVIVDLWLVALGFPIANSICKLDDWIVKSQYDHEGGLKVTRTFQPISNSWALRGG